MRGRRSRSATARLRDGLTEPPSNFIYSQRGEKENIDKTPKIMTMIMVVATKSGFKSLLHKGEVLAPLTLGTLNENHLVSCAH